MQTSALNTRIASVYERADKSGDRRTSDEPQRAVLHAGERLLRTIPDQNILEPALDRETQTYAIGTPDQRLAGVAKLAGLFIELDSVGYAKLTHIERHTCRALVAHHDAAEGRGNRVADIFNL